MTRPAIRIAEANDAQGIAELTSVMALGRTRREYARTLELLVHGGETKHHLFLVAEDDRGIVAFGRAQWLHKDSPWLLPFTPLGGYLLGVLIHPRLRRKGIARALVERRVAWIAQRANIAFSFTHRHNFASLAMHAAAGFTIVQRGVHGGPFRRGDGVLLARRPLQG